MTQPTINSEITKLLSDPKYRIQLHKLVQDKTDKAYKVIQDLEPQTHSVEQVAKKFIEDSEKASHDLQTIFAYGCYFGTADQAYLWTNALNQLGTFAQSNGSTFLIDLQIYPALLTVYMGGVSAVAANNPESLAAVLNTNVKRIGQGETRLVTRANCWSLDSHAPQLLNIEKNRHTPLSDYLEELVSQNIPKEILLGQGLEDLFDKWEIILAMILADDQRERDSQPWVPVGRFGWRSKYEGGSLDVVEREINAAGNSWFALKGGLFGGSEKRAKESLGKVKELAQRRFFL